MHIISALYINRADYTQSVALYGTIEEAIENEISELELNDIQEATFRKQVSETGIYSDGEMWIEFESHYLELKP